MKEKEINEKQTQRIVRLFKQMKHQGELRNVAKRYLGFATPDLGENEGISRVKRPKLDLVSTRICEKRRRDRMNDRLADLRRLIPASYVKQGKGRVQKVEIIDMAIQHIKDLTKNIEQEHTGLASNLPDRYLGFKECQDEVMRFLVEVENWDVHDKLCIRMMKHLEQSGEKFRIMNDECSSKAIKQDKRLIPQIQAPFTYLQNNYEMNTPFLSTSKLVLTLPTTRCYNTSCTEDSSQSSEPGSSSSSSTNKNRQCFDFSCIHYDESKEPVPMGNNPGRPRSMGNNPGRPRSMGNRSHDVACSYKFKRTIATRFFEDITSRVNKSCDSSSTISKEFTWPSAKRMLRNEFTRSACSTSPSYSPRPGSSNNSSCIDESTRCSNGDKITSSYQPGFVLHPQPGSSNNSSCTGESTRCSNGDKITSSYQPGFVLHPTGSFYIPLSVNASNADFNKYTKDEEQQRCMTFHSVKIPVIFDG